MKQIPFRRLAVMILSIPVMGLGVALFRLSLMGNDPSTAFAIAVSDNLRVDMSLGIILMNSLYFVAELLLGRHMIGVGTFFNWFGVGPAASLWLRLLTGVFTFPEDFAGRLLVMIPGVLVLSFSAAMIQVADTGIGTYDSLSLIMAERLPIRYFWCRMITDAVCTALAFLLGGIIGLGTLACALGLGPFINFFSKYAAAPMCGVTWDK